ncbi:MAG: class I SAM-dependent methyltransferase [bacterium]|nr:class I SAM-dependent methyltransferase [bacterium]
MGFVDSIGITKKFTRHRQEVFIKKYASNKSTLDIGCGNDIYRSHFPNCTTLDIEVRPDVHVDIIADVHDLSIIKDEMYDVILCAEVLEHLHTPAKAIAEMRRILKLGGIIILTTRFIFPLHDVPHDYYRYTKYGLIHLMKEFEILELKEEASTMETLVVLYQRLGFQCDTLALSPLKYFGSYLQSLRCSFHGLLQKSMETLVINNLNNIYYRLDILSLLKNRCYRLRYFLPDSEIFSVFSIFLRS